MKVVVIVQARMSSTRLPGKVLKTVLGKPLLEHQMERVRRVGDVDEVVIATSVNPSDSAIAEFCRRLSLPCVRGPEQDVLSRYHAAAVEHGADVVVRLTADCPIIDPRVVEKVLRHFLANAGGFDYVSNCLARTYPRGMDTEVMPFRVLDEAFREAVEPGDREHVTPFVYRQPRRYRLANVAYTRDLSRHRWTVDTKEDFALIRRIIEALYPQRPDFRMEDVLDLLDRRPHLFRINAHVEQNKTGDEAAFQGGGPKTHE